tara:strand:- start:369 stop:917 length:549 start_codon:yes stop_codon:yes gene_type:complete
MSLFEINKIIAAIILALVVIFLINKIGNYTINPKVLEEQAYKVEIPETKISSEISTNESKTTSDIEPVSNFLINASLEKGSKLANKCASCHNFKEGEPNKIGPNLFDIINKEIGKTSGYAYSKAMSNFGGKWTYENLATFLYKPKDYMSGTKMNFAGLKKVQDRADIVLWLRNNSDKPATLP